MKLQDFIGKDLKYNMEGIASDQELATQIQVLLIGFGLLESPADGKFGPISAAALKKFQTLMKINEPEGLGAITAEKLIETKPEDLPAPPLKLGNDLASRIAKYMQLKKYEIFQGIREYNIVYIEGMNADGTLNDDRPNNFNDRRIVFQIIDGVPVIVGNWEATTEPGYHYTHRPMDSSKGAARIKFGQYKAWQVGIHGTADRHEALVQTGGEVTVHRDFNKDFQRVGDKLDTGYFGINQHWGYDLPSNNVYYASAGCLVGRARQGHREFMSLIKKDRRYQLNNRYVFYSTVIYGPDLLKETGGLEPVELLKEGSSGPLVKQLQQRLKDKGFNPGDIDGVLGLGTKAAVRAFQKANGLEADGVVGPQTWNALGMS